MIWKTLTGIAATLTVGGIAAVIVLYSDVQILKSEVVAYKDTIDELKRRIVIINDGDAPREGRLAKIEVRLDTVVETLKRIEAAVDETNQTRRRDDLECMLGPIKPGVIPPKRM